MPKFVLLPETESFIDIESVDGKVLCSIEALDAIELYSQAHQASMKLGKELVDTYIDMVCERYNITLTRSQAITLFNYASDLMEDIKKKSCQSQNQYDSMELLRKGLESEISDS